MTRSLQERAGVPDSRLERPIMTKIDNHILIGEEDVRNITAKYGAQDDFHWYDIFEYLPDWETFVKDLAAPRVGEEDSVTEDTVMIMNSGPHVWMSS